MCAYVSCPVHVCGSDVQMMTHLVLLTLVASAAMASARSVAVGLCRVPLFVSMSASVYVCSCVLPVKVAA